MTHRAIEGFTLWGVYTFLHPNTFDLCQDRDPLGFYFTEEKAEEAKVEYEKNPDEKYDYVYVEEDWQLDL